MKAKRKSIQAASIAITLLKVQIVTLELSGGNVASVPNGGVFQKIYGKIYIITNQIKLKPSNVI